MARWGEVVALVATIVVGILVALIPSRLEAQVEHIAERLQQPLANFQAIYAKTLELLLWLKDEPGSVFIMTSATPVFGIELNAADRSRWANALRRRIVTQVIKLVYDYVLTQSWDVLSAFRSDPRTPCAKGKVRGAS